MTALTASEAYARAAQAFAARNSKSKAIYDEATKSLPGGNTRSSIFYQPFPLSVECAEAARLYDVDGHEYTDFLGEYSAGLYGHSDPTILRTISDTLRNGLNFGSQHENENKLATAIKARFPSIDLLRFTNSGTEATLLALAASTAFTRRKKVVVFEGGYHGGAFTFRTGKSSPINAPFEYLIARYNDVQSVHELLNDPENAGQVAAILVEPMQGSGGAIVARRDFLINLREAATDAGSVLIFDEVMTARMHEGGGIQSQFPLELRPDLTTLGKYIGGGMSFGAFGGKRAIMDMFDPRNANGLTHAGTYNNNTLTMSAGLTGLEQIFTPQRARELHEAGEELRRSLLEVAEGTLMTVTGCGSLMCFHFTATDPKDIRSLRDVQDHNRTLGDLLHLFLLEKGYYIGRRGFMALCLPLSAQDYEGFVRTIKEFLSTYASLVVSESRPRL